MDSDRDYSYDELLQRVFGIMRDRNPDMVAGEKKKFVMRPPQVVKVGTKKTAFVNFTEIAKMYENLSDTSRLMLNGKGFIVGAGHIPIYTIVPCSLNYQTSLIVFYNICHFQAASSTQAPVVLPHCRAWYPRGGHRRQRPTHPQGPLPAEAYRERAQTLHQGMILRLVQLRKIIFDIFEPQTHFVLYDFLYPM